MSKKGKRALDIAAERLRAISLEAAPGSLLGTEESLIGAVGASRSTMRQAARLLEREGLIRVKTGLNGGYFAARPDAATIEMAVSSYLETLHTDPRDITEVASALWVLVVRKAAKVRDAETLAALVDLKRKVSALSPEVGFAAVRTLERESHGAMLKASNSGYIQLILDINIAFSRRTFPDTTALDGSPLHQEFVVAWRRAKFLELEAIEAGDPELAALAAQHTRRLWHQRIWGFRPGDVDPARIDSAP